MTRDLTDLIEELRASLGMFEMALNAVPQGIVSVDSKGTILWCNAAFERIAGRRRIELIGSPVQRTLSLRRQGRIVAWREHPANLASKAWEGKSIPYELIAKNKNLPIRISRNRFGAGQKHTGIVLVVNHP